MGCTCSSLKYIDVYTAMREALAMDESSCGKRPSIASVQRRSKVFAKWMKQCLADSGDVSLINSSFTAREKRDASLATPAFYEAGIPVNDLINTVAHTEWGVRSIHAFNRLLPLRGAQAVTQTRALIAAPEANPNCTTDSPTASHAVLTRSNFRLWMLFQCEYYHILAIFQGAKAIPKTMRKWLRKIEKNTRKMSLVDAQGKLGAEALKASDEGYTITVRSKYFSERLMRRLCVALPTVFAPASSATIAPGQPLPSNQERIAEALVKEVGEYWRGAETLYPVGCNPLADCGNGVSSPLADDAVPFLALVEWLVLRHVMSLIGPEEEDLEGYLNSGGDAPVKRTEKAAPTPTPQEDSFLDEDTIDLEKVRQWLARHRELEAELSADAAAGGEQLSDKERASKTYEKAEVEKRLCALFRRLAISGSEGSSSDTLTQDGAAEGTYSVFNMAALFPYKDVHALLSDCAYRAAVGFNTETRESEVPWLSGGDDENQRQRFRLFLSCYLALQDLYVDAIGVQDEACLGDIVCPLLCHPFSALASITNAREGGGFLFDDDPEDSAAEEEENIRDLFNSLAQNVFGKRDDDRAVDFADLCEFVAQRCSHRHYTHLHQLKATPLSPLSELKERLGIAEQDRDDAKCADCIRQILRAAAGGCDDAEVASESDITAAIEAIVELSKYTRAPDTASYAAICYAAPASASQVSGSVGGTGTNANSVEQQRRKWIANLAQETSTAQESATVFVLARLLACSLFASTASMRCFANTRHAAATKENSWKRMKMTLQGELKLPTQVDYKWFCRAIGASADALGFSSEELVADAAIHLGISAPTRGSSAVADPLADAFAALAEKNQKGKRRDRTVGALMSSLGDIVHVILSNYATLYAFRAQLTMGEAAALLTVFEAQVRALQQAMPCPLSNLHSCYSEFFLLTGGRRRVMEGGTSVQEKDEAEREAMNLTEFAAAFRHRYAEQLSPFCTSEDQFLQMCRDALRHVTRDSCGDAAGCLEARHYAAFTQYICGHLLTSGAFAIASRTQVVSAACKSPQQELNGVVTTDFIERLFAFSSSSSGHSDAVVGGGAIGGGGEAAAALGAVRERLDSNVDSGVASAVSTWYAEHFANMVPTAEVDWWTMRGPARAIPFSFLYDHRQTRLRLLADCKALQRQVGGGNAAEGDDDDDDDEYIATDVLARMMSGKFPDLLHFLGHLDGSHQLNTPQPGTGADDRELRWFAFVRDCVTKTNVAANRADLGDSELHRRDLRFLFQYMHHLATGFYASEEAVRELNGMRGAAAAVGEDVDAEQAFQASFFALAFEHLHLGPTAKAQAEKVIASFLADSARSSSSDAAAAAAIDSRKLAELLAMCLVRCSQDTCGCAQVVYTERKEAQLMEAFQKEYLLGVCAVNAETGAKVRAGTYWQRLRLLLPQGDSRQQRQLRAELFAKMDHFGRGYLTLADLYTGIVDMRLQEYRQDILPVLFKAFFATKEVTFAFTDVVYLTKGNEQFLWASEFCAFLRYLYRYMELYFMYDLLTCVGQVLHGVTLSYHLSSPHAGGGDAVFVSKSNATKERDPPCDEEAALGIAADEPYAVALLAAHAPKKVDAGQFAAAHKILRKWGVRVRRSKVPVVFRYINRRCLEGGEMYFSGFAVWASERNLRPEGYGSGFEENSDELAHIEQELTYAPVHPSPLPLMVDGVLKFQETT